MASTTNQLKLYSFNKKELQIELRKYGAKVGGKINELRNRLTRFRNNKPISSDFPYGKVPNKYKQCSKDTTPLVFDDDCCICMEEIHTDGMKTKCNHGFHKKCINKWLKNDSRCPLCRTQVGKTITKQSVAHT